MRKEIPTHVRVGISDGDTILVRGTLSMALLQHQRTLCQLVRDTETHVRVGTHTRTHTHTRLSPSKKSPSYLS